MQKKLRVSYILLVDIGTQTGFAAGEPCMHRRFRSLIEAVPGFRSMPCKPLKERGVVRGVAVVISIAGFVLLD